MLSMMIASAVKRFSATQSPAAKKMLNSSGASTPLPKTLLHVEHIRALAIIQPHACPHAVVELVNDGKHSRRNAKASQDCPQEVLNSDTPGLAGKICPQRGRRCDSLGFAPPIGSINRCHSLRLLLLSYLNHRPRPRWERRATAMTLGSRAMTQPRTKG